MKRSATRSHRKTHAKRNTALTLKRGGTHTNEQSTKTNNPTKRCAGTQQPQRDAVQQRTRDNSTPQPQYCGTPHCARDSAGNACPGRPSYIARMTFFTFSQAQHAPHAHADKRRPPRYHHTAHTRARRHTKCDKTHTPQRHVSVMARVTRNSARRQATHRTTNTHVSHARTTSRTAATTAQCANITARTPPHAHHTGTVHGTQLRPPHKPPTKQSHPVTHAASAPHSR
jgi:hypothetical protein